MAFLPRMPAAAPPSQAQGQHVQSQAGKHSSSSGYAPLLPKVTPAGASGGGYAPGRSNPDIASMMTQQRQGQHNGAGHNYGMASSSYTTSNSNTGYNQGRDASPSRYPSYAAQAGAGANATMVRTRFAAAAALMKADATSRYPGPAEYAETLFTELALALRSQWKPIQIAITGGSPPNAVVRELLRRVQTWVSELQNVAFAHQPAAERLAALVRTLSALELQQLQMVCDQMDHLELADYIRACGDPSGGEQALRQRVAAPARVARVVLPPLRSVATAGKAEITAYTTQEKGPQESLEYRMFFKQGAKDISCWHEIPLYAGDGCVHYICEIPKETSAKMEVATDEPMTPIKQDVKKGKLRFYPYNINWNYGLLPQTWEDPGVTNAELGAAGDNDPVDVVEIGVAAGKRGGVYKVKPVGVYAMIDDGELDWKVIAINMDDPKAALINDVEDVEKHYPGQLQKVLEWFRDYKIPDGKPANKFGYDNKCMNKEFTMHVIKETHEAYVNLKSGARANNEELSLI